MVYKIKEEKVKEIKNGRSNLYIASTIGCTEQHLCNIFSGKSNCSKSLAILLSLINNDSEYMNLALDDKINIYFNPIED